MCTRRSAALLVALGFLVVSCAGRSGSDVLPGFAGEPHEETSGWSFFGEEQLERRKHVFVGQREAGWEDFLDEDVDRVRAADEVFLELNDTSSTRAVPLLIEAYRKTHGPWTTVHLSTTGPDWLFESHKAVLSAAKTEFEQGEPVLVTLRTEPEVHWRDLTVLHLRIQDERGCDVNPFLTPVCAGDGVVRSKIDTTLDGVTFDLTCFLLPYDGIEYVCRFAPGRYTVTYYFVVGTGAGFAPPQWEMLATSRQWGRLHSNSVAFTVLPRAREEPAGSVGMLGLVKALLARREANRAVDACKRIILASSDERTIFEAISCIRSIRDQVSWDDDKWRDEKWMAERIAAISLRAPESLSEDRKQHILTLVLLHLSAHTRRELFHKWVRECADAGTDLSEPEWSDERLSALCSRELYAFPQFRPLVEEALRSPGTCPWPCAEAYFSRHFGGRELAVVRGLLPVFPQTVLDYYADHKAPKQLLPHFLPYLDVDDEGTADLAAAAIEKAAGLSIGLIRRKENGRPAFGNFVVDRPTVRKLLRQWWEMKPRPGEEEGF